MAKQGTCPLGCGASSSPLYATVSLRSESPDENHAEVKIRKGVMVETTGGKRRLMPGESLKMSFSGLQDLLQQQGSIFYFKKASEKTLFLLLYPEYQTADL